MILRLPEIGLTLLLVGGFAAVGETLLGRRSRDIFSWNESFVVGMGSVSASLFPLSRLFRKDSLEPVLVLMGLALILRVSRLQPIPNAPALSPSIPARIGPDWISRGLLAAIVLSVLAFCALDFRYGYLWDGFQVWATKGALLYFRGTPGREWLPGEVYDARILRYPLMVPMWEALLARVRGGFDFDALKPVFVPFFISMLISTCGAARAVVGRRSALVATLLLAATPALSTGTNAGGYADMPLAACVAAVVAAALRRKATPGGWRQPLPWLIGSLTTVKAEGTLLAAVASGAVVLGWLFEPPPARGRSLRAQWSGALVVATLIGAHLAYLRWLGVRDTTFAPLDLAHIARVPMLIEPLAKLSFGLMFDPATWGLFWPAFLLATVALRIRGERRLFRIALAVLVAIAIYSSIFLFTNWDLALHVEGSYDRLLAQLAPAAAVVILGGWECLHPRPGTRSARSA